MTELRLPEINRVILGGRLTRDPEARYAGDGTPVTTLELVFHRWYRGRDGKPVEDPGYVTVRTYQRLAEVCGQHLHRGSAVLVEGRLQTRKDPQGKTPARLELRADNVHFMDRAPELPGAEGMQQSGREGGETPA
jgi:single-strand DNA-binding protein